MFRISFFVEDKHLPPVLHSINGKVLNLEVLPVVNAAATNGTQLTEEIKEDLIQYLVEGNNPRDLAISILELYDGCQIAELIEEARKAGEDDGKDS